MSRSPFEPGFAELPQIIPVFPLPGVLLLPEGTLPLNIFEPRYLAMTGDAMMTAQRIIGMIQPTDPQGVTGQGDDNPPCYAIGCAGRITQFSESEDGRYMVTLSGLCRFTVKQELALQRGYRRVIADWSRFKADMTEAPATPRIERERLNRTLKAFFRKQKIDANWDAIRDTPDDKLVTSLAMICPFGPAEKQALLECNDLLERAKLLTGLMEMALIEPAAADTPTRRQ